MTATSSIYNVKFRLLCNSGFWELNGPPWNSDLAPNCNLMFELTPKFLKGKKFHSSE
jgi:hypothetical protein